MKSLVLLGLLVVFTATVASQEDPEANYQAGRTAFLAEDLMTAISRLTPAAEAGYAPAQTLLAYIMDVSSFNDEAFSLYTKAANQGYAEGMLGLSEMYFKGEGTPPNPEQGLSWLTKAAEAGNLVALIKLARVYRRGEYGQPIDEAQARLLEARAHELSGPEAEKGSVEGDAVATGGKTKNR